ncbi:ABC transporter permease subunit [Umezawaea tangerina]|uniref:ABC-2 family transporter n=1 Tax=Umezawaea tangerina TaxID=84725 RepID=A0A2T0T1H8_9PSEU|nr:ABC transporter permease subunit [Umezawaea tangerina]PRY39530.1 ABC-2 family transporter [Umezawaea tangerina]
MTWIVWRLQRPLFITLAAGIVLAVGGALLLRAVMTADIAAAGLADCVREGLQRGVGGACGSRQVMEFQNAWGNRMWVAQVLVLGLPVLVGVFVGAPLFAREYEQGTHALAFTQSVSRTRWMVTKFLVTVLPALTAVVVIQLAVAHWVAAAGELGPQQSGPFTAISFGVAGVSPAAYALCAYTLGMFVGAVSKRTLVGMSLALGAFVVIRFVVDGFRESLGTTTRVTFDDPFERVDKSAGLTVDGGWLTADGKEVTDTSRYDFSDCATKDSTTCYHEKGLVKSFYDIIPADAVGALHLAEASIFVALSAVFVAGTVWAVRRQV